MFFNSRDIVIFAQPSLLYAFLKQSGGDCLLPPDIIGRVVGSWEEGRIGEYVEEQPLGRKREKGRGREREREISLSKPSSILIHLTKAFFRSPSPPSPNRFNPSSHHPPPSSLTFHFFLFFLPQHTSTYNTFFLILHALSTTFPILQILSHSFTSTSVS